VLILASALPRRADLLREAGIDAVIQPADVNEDVKPGEGPEAYVRRVADAKGRAISVRAPGRFVLAADTAVVVDGQILGKPSSDDDAARMLRLLSGRSHLVISGVCLMKNGAPAVQTEVETTAVEFAELSSAEIAWYVSSGESMDKAGGYGIQGLASRFVTGITGSYTNVVGLPIALVYRMCIKAGLLLS
jgi:septum formation protein